MTPDPYTAVDALHAWLSTLALVVSVAFVVGAASVLARFARSALRFVAGTPARDRYRATDDVVRAASARAAETDWTRHGPTAWSYAESPQERARRIADAAIEAEKHVDFETLERALRHQRSRRFDPSPRQRSLPR